MASKKDDKPNGKVGYGHPPARSKFQKGRSGNPKGRPRGSRNFDTAVKQMLKAPVSIERNGTARKVSTQDASLFRLREKALKGDVRALNRMLELAAKHNDAGDDQLSGEEMAREDREIIELFKARLRGEVHATREIEPPAPKGAEGDDKDE